MGNPKHPREGPRWRPPSIPKKDGSGRPRAAGRWLLPEGLSSSPALTTDPAGDAAMPGCPRPCPRRGAAPTSRQLCGLGAVAVLSSRQISAGRCVSSRLFVTVLIFSVCAGGAINQPRDEELKRC